VNEVCDDLAFDCSRDFKFNVAEIKNKFSTLEILRDLKDEKELKRIENELFKKNGKLDEAPFEVYISLCKFDVKPGSKGSKALLSGIQAAGENEQEIYCNKIIKNLLDYKF
jgi:hypothetical protein